MKTISLAIRLVDIMLISLMVLLPSYLSNSAIPIAGLVLVFLLTLWITKEND